jgi:hypothetical protein
MHHIQYSGPARPAWTVGRRGEEDSGMSFRRPRPGRDIRIASREDPLRLFLGNYRLTACCRRPGCAHRRDLHTELLGPGVRS